MALWPQGEYAMRAEEISEPAKSRSEHYYCRVRLRILGSDHDVYWLISESPNAEWVWRGVIDSFADREQLLGRVFLFSLKYETWQSETHERVRLIVELPGDEQETTAC